MSTLRSVRRPGVSRKKGGGWREKGREWYPKEEGERKRRRSCNPSQVTLPSKKSKGKCSGRKGIPCFRPITLSKKKRKKEKGDRHHGNTRKRRDKGLLAELGTL